MKAEIKFSKYARILCFSILTLIIALAVFNTYIFKREDSGDVNVYLNEEVCFARQVHISVIGINVTENTNELDSDGDKLSQYILNLRLKIYQDDSNFFTSAKVSLKPENFSLKSVNLKSKTKMNVFINCLFKETVSIMASGAIEGGINIIEETISFAEDYLQDSIENVINSNVDFKPIKPLYASFNNINPRKDGLKIVEISFPIKQCYLESENVIVLSIDKVNRIEKRIFLIARPK